MRSLTTSISIFSLLSLILIHSTSSVQILSKSKLQKCEKQDSSSSNLNCTSKIVINLAVPSESVTFSPLIICIICVCWFLLMFVMFRVGEKPLLWQNWWRWKQRGIRALPICELFEFRLLLLLTSLLLMPLTNWLTLEYVYIHCLILRASFCVCIFFQIVACKYVVVICSWNFN